MPELPPAARDQFGVFTYEQAAAHGWSKSALSHAVRQERLVRLRRGVYADSGVMAGSDAAARRRQLIVRSCAAVLAERDSIASHRSAAALAGLPILTTPATPCVTIAPSRHGAIEGVHLHRAGLARPSDVVRAGLIERTSTARTAVDIAREVGVDEAVVVGDAALHRGMTDVHRLRAVAHRYSHWPGMRRAFEAIDRCDGRAESPLESISRLRIGESDLPTPQLQVEISDHRGQWLGRTDFFWEEFGVVGEADGMEKYDGVGPSPLRAEKRRQERLEQAGLVVVRWGWADLRNLPEFAARLERGLASAAVRPAADRLWIAA